MRPELAQSDWPRHGAFRPTLRAKATIVGGARDCAVRHLLARIAIAMLISAAASSSSADAVRSGPAIALPYGDIIIPVPAPPSNADPMNPASPSDVVTQRNNNLRTGTTLGGGLGRSSVLDKAFGFLKALDVDGVVLAQPLFMETVEFPPGRQRPAVFIATSTNWVYAFDADPPFAKLWERRLGDPFQTRKDPQDKTCSGQMAITEQQPLVAADGIMSTPVIDVARKHIILVYRQWDGNSQDLHNGGTQRIAALDLGTGNVVLDHSVTDDQDWNLSPQSRGPAVGRWAGLRRLRRAMRSGAVG